MDQQRNLLLAIVFSLAILLFFEFYLAPPPGEQQAPADQAGEQVAGQTGGQTGSPQPQGVGAPQLPGASAPEQLSGAQSREQALADGPRLIIETPTLTGSIALQGGRFDDLTLTQFHETVDKSSPNIDLLHPTGTLEPYFADFGWATLDRSIPMPGPDSLWQADGDLLAPGRPVTLTWDNGQGLAFERRIEVDEHYLFTVTQSVDNRSSDPITLSSYGLVSRTGTPDVLGFYILHEGLFGVFDGTLKEVDYDDLQDDGTIQQSTTGGWIGITDKYWMVSLVPDQERPADTRFVHELRDGADKYQTDYLYEAVTIPAGASASSTSRLFAGAKQVLQLDAYRDELGIEGFDRSVDFGWFYFLTKPLFYALHYMADMTGNFGVAILLLTVAIKLVFFPLANKSYVSMAKMRKLQPEMLALRERYSDDKQRLNQEMMALYKKEGANPMSGCLPILIQIPVFFALYKVLFVTIEMRHAPFFGWIQDLSARDPTSILNLFGLMPWDVPFLGAFDVINLGVWPLLMGISMFLQQQLNPQPPDPIQAKIFLFMPIIFTFLLASFPAGLVIYWTWNNLLSILQQAVIMKRAGVPIGRQPAPPSTTSSGQT